ncbi:ComEA family DNA-binding protein [Vibrio sonorensis]|uniref:ComEA family DNA-binding protein n=1 Tax=Vibrio sonorensis TaxID=1004316 RepID=UPI0008DAD636|nr:helix-hairpin-helix domain-containing protein [Vibrio sonorensis]
MKLLLALVLILMPVFAFAEQSAQTDPKLEGIEITVNVNTASAEELAELLKGVGTKKAQEIVKYREEHGPYKDAIDLQKVKGIGSKLVSDNQGRLRY